jgi:dephospho-CoA kinase
MQMIRIGLTGGVGMGKSTASKLLSDLGLPVIDTDTVARQVVEPGQPALADILNRFGKDILAHDGTLRRDVLAQRVFGNPTELHALEGILHPRIRQVWQAQVDRWRGEGRPAGVVTIPLLFETGAAAAFDAVICVACSAATQLERLKPRGWDERQIAQRLQAQWPIEKKIDSANFVVWSEGIIDVLRDQLERILVTLGIQV